MLVRRGELQEIMIAFVLVMVMIFTVLFFLSINAKTNILFSNIKHNSLRYDVAEQVFSTILECHETTFLDEEKLNNRTSCPAATISGGYTIHQLPMNGCEEKRWTFSNGNYSSSLPFVVSILQNDSEKKCLAVMEVRLT